ncbi:serine/threonine protein kinase [Nocardia sp. NBC_00565]|uniref:serine/threonine-protein kinase n=1 Tax=Nocardia sp. NBC_00565 TaxID=2975993 RepID=UPI002E8040B4|nr:serine/threonine-protein kinase [Nocardia sp. NBC_00565]WUC05375.1 serine/threonine protein kinase [Nocardia sp. NBC_00565]
MTADRLIAGRYRLTDPIGTGAMGVVWRATDVRLRRTVAVKQLILGPGLSRSQALEAKLRAMREGRIAARLHHPNAITVFDVAEEDGQPWLVMEYMDAPSLAAKLSGKRTLAPTEVARIGAQAAGALAAAHDAGIMHRDVKPANLLVADDGTVKITDFGISRAVGDVTVTATGFLAGTPAYLAPEVARGENPEPASDVFALGSTLYAAVEGTPPFGEGDNALAVLHAAARAQVPPPRHAGELGPVLMRLLAASIDGRPNMREAKAALEAVAAGRTPALATTPAVTKVMPAPGAVPDSDAGATTILNKSRTAGNSANAAGMVGAAAPAVTVAPPPAPPKSGGTLPGGGGGGEQSRGRLIAVAAVAAVAVLVLVAVIASSLKNDNSDSTAVGSATSAPAVNNPENNAPQSPIAIEPGQPEPQTPPTTTPPSSTPTPTTSAKPSTSAPPTTTTTPSGPATADRISQFVYGYYGMLPGNAQGAWSQLTPAYQAQTGGFGSYSQFWSTVRSVSVGAVTSSGENRAVVSLTYSLKSGSTSSENRWIQVASDNGRLLIAASGL